MWFQAAESIFLGWTQDGISTTIDWASMGGGIIWASISIDIRDLGLANVLIYTVSFAVRLTFAFDFIIGALNWACFDAVGNALICSFTSNMIFKSKT